jgi:hypothetical protein
VATIHEVFEAALAELESLKRVLKKRTDSQVRGAGERALVKATSYSYFNNHRATIAPAYTPMQLEAQDEDYKILFDWCERAVARKSYMTQIGVLRSYLVQGRANAMVVPAVATNDAPPDFSKLVGDAKMQGILANRWRECITCVGAKAPLAATVMMGGLLEAVLLARVNRETNKAPIFTAKGAAKDHNGKTKPLNEWTLQHYISVAHELGWITVTAMSVSEVLRDYRNYVHPHKEYSHGIVLKPEDAVLWWEIGKTIVRQVVAGAP